MRLVLRMHGIEAGIEARRKADHRRFDGDPRGMLGREPGLEQQRDAGEKKEIRSSGLAVLGLAALLHDRLRDRQEDVEPRPLTRRAVQRNPPPWDATMPCTTESPSPVPSPTGLVVKNGSNTRRRVTSSMPHPVSLTER
jgi:hypothetical protein